MVVGALLTSRIGVKLSMAAQGVPFLVVGALPASWTVGRLPMAAQGVPFLGGWRAMHKSVRGEVAYGMTRCTLFCRLARFAQASWGAGCR